MEQNKRRLNYLDYAKGIGILLVVLAHIYCFNPKLQESMIVVWIYSFHMPLFFIISGMLIKFKDEKLSKNIILKKIKNILIPYLFFSILSSIIKIIIYELNTSMIIWDLIYTCIGYGIDVLWFLPALFVAEILMLLIFKISKSDYMRMIIIGSLFIVGLSITKSYGMILLIIGRCFIATGFVSIGYYGFNRMNSHDVNTLFLIVLLLISIFSAKYNGRVDFMNLVHNNHILYIFNLILGTIIVIQFCKKIYNLNLLSYFGKNSIVILGIHMNLIYLVRRFIELDLYKYTTGLVLFFILLIIHIPMIDLYNKLFSLTKKKVQTITD